MALVTAGGAGIAHLLISTAPPPVRREVEDQATRVQATPVATQRVQESLVGYGTARPDQTSTLSAQVNGEVVEVAKGLEDGSEIQQGQLLIRIEEADYRHQLERARNLIKADEAVLKQLKLERGNLERLIQNAKQELGIAQDEYSRVDRLYKKKVAAKREWDLARSSVLRVQRELENLETKLALLEPRREQAEASIAAHRAEESLAKLHLDRCRILAPFDGRVHKRQVEIGETVRSGQPLLTVLKLDRIEVPIELPASCAAKIKIGNRCRLFVESMPGEQWSGVIERIGPAADERSRTFTAYVVVDNTKQSRPLLPGLFIRAEVEGPVHSEAIVVPRGAIREGAVFVAEQGLARKKPVTLTCALRDVAVIETGLEPGEKVILTNLASLHDGAPVDVHPPEQKLANGRKANAATTRPVGEAPKGNGLR